MYIVQFVACTQHALYLIDDGRRRQRRLPHARGYVIILSILCLIFASDR